MHRLLTTAAMIAAVGGLAVGCGDDDSGSEQRFSAELKPPSEAENGFTYDDALAPSGAEVTATVAQGDDSTTVVLEVKGLQQDRGYAAHLHTEPCGNDPSDAGPHFQHELDPAAGDKPSTDPAFANKDNEFWLDFRTNGKGEGQSGTTVEFQLADDRRPASLVIHAEEETATAPGRAGSAGGRVACLNLDLS